MVASRGTPRMAYGSKESRFGWRGDDDDALFVAPPLAALAPPWLCPPFPFACRSVGVRCFDLCPADDEAGGLLDD